MIFDAVIYDIEIQKAILGKGEDPVPGVKYCDGWNDHKGMGIGVICAMDTRNAIMRVFLEDNLDDFARLIEGRTIVGYNSKTFDDKIITVNGINTSANQVDLFDLVTKAAGNRIAGRKVDDIARVNLGGMQKSMNGALAPILYQQGKIGTVVDYCCRDCSLEYAIASLCPTLIDPVSGRVLSIDIPAYARAA